MTPLEQLQQAAGDDEDFPEPERFRFALPEDPAQRDRLAELGSIAGGLVHELKNPIGAIRLNVDMILADCTKSDGTLDTAKTERRLRRISAGVDHLQDISNSFLSFARPGKPTHGRVDINDLLQDVVDAQRPLFTEDDIIISFLPNPDLSAVPADPSQLRSVFLNIVLNAREALLNKEGERKVVIATRNSHNGIRVLLHNNGPPLSENAAAHLFDPFYSTKQGGTGLGLAIVRRLLELHHGRVTAASDPDQGVSFTVELPTKLGPARTRTELPLPLSEVTVHEE